MEPMVFGNDLGMGANKLHGPHGGVQVLSQVATNGTQKITSMAGLTVKHPPLEVRTLNGSFYVGDGAHDWGRPVENMDYDRLTGAPEMIALFYAGFTRYMQEHGEIRTPVSIVAGLPLETMTGGEAAGNGDAVRKWMRPAGGEHTWTADGKVYRLCVEEARCTSQPVGAFFDYLLTIDGRPMAARKQATTAEVGIVSVGFNTTELLVVRNRQPVQRFTAGNRSGVRRLLELVNRDGLYSLGELDTMLRAGALDVSAALPVWAREVGGQIERHWGTAHKRFSSVIVVGGGALLLGPALTDRFNGKAIVPDDPVGATARGLYKMGQAKARK